jgi:alpha-L-rhamnosidase
MDLGLLNFDGIRFYEKWIEDIIDNQTSEGRISGIIPSSGWGYDDWIGPVWDAAIFIVPMALYDYYGDKQSISSVYGTCERYLAYLAARENNDGCVTHGIGDWVPYKTQTPTEYTTSCYYYLDNLYMSKFADILGRDGSVYKEKAEKLKVLINSKYFDSQKNSYANGSQTSLAIALYLGIVPNELEQKVADNLYLTVKENNGYLDFGMLGSKTVLRMLSKYGYADMAYKMASKEDEPSWGAWIKKGFNTMHETWTLSPEFRDASINHMFLGDINAWMYNVLAGINIDPDSPGFRHILIQPHFVEGLDWVKGEYNSVKGLIRSEWKRVENNVQLEIEIPINTTATIEVMDKKISVEGGKHTFKF